MEHENRIVHSRLQRMRVIFILGCLAAFGPLTIDMYLPSLPMLAGDFNTSASMVQLSLTACLLGLASGQFFIGSISDVYGRKKPLMIALAVYTVSSLLCSAAPSIGLFILLRFVQGFAGAAGIVIARACIRDLFSGSNLTKYYALLMLVVGVAPIFAPIAGGQLLHFVPWPGIFGALSLIGGILLLVVSFGLSETLPVTDRQKGGLGNTYKIYAGLIRDRSFIGYGLTMGLVFAAMFAYISGSSFVFQEIFDVTPQTYSLIFALNGAGIICGTQITGRLAGKVRETALLTTGLSVALFGGLFLLFAILTGAGLAMVMIALFFVVSSVGVVNTTTLSLAMQNQKKNAGSASALLGLLQFVLGALVAPFVGLGGSQTALPMALIIAVCEIGACAIYIGMIKKQPLFFTEEQNVEK